MSAVTNSTVPPARPGGPAPSRGISSELIIVYINVFIFSVVALGVLLRLPHLLGLLRATPAWWNGHLLRHVELRSLTRDFILRSQSTRTLVAAKEYGSSEASHTYISQPTTQDHKRAPDAGVGSAKHPPHIPSIPGFLRPCLTLFRTRVVPGVSVGQVVILLNYLYILLFAAFFQSNPLNKPNRPGWVALSQLPLVFALAQKNNVLGSLLGYGYERLNFIHRFAGQLVVLGSNIHAIGYFYKWTIAGTFSEAMEEPSNIWAMVALVCMDLLYILSISFFRQKMYNVFLWSHTITAVLVMPALYYHDSHTIPYVLGCVGVYAFDRLMRLVKSRIATGTLVYLPQLDLTHIEIPSINAGWEAGQHVRLRVLSSGMGLVGWTESHPFTIASASRSQDGLVLMCKKYGTWTRQLAELAKHNNGAGGDGQTAQVKLWIEGPFGGPGRMVFSSFSAALLVVGGSGITFGLSMVQELVMKDLKGESTLKVVELVWVVQDPSSILPLMPRLTALIQQSFTPLLISVFYSRPLTGQLPLLASLDAPPHSKITIHPNLTVSPGRPRLPATLDGVISRTLNSASGPDSSLRGVAVGVCGPTALGDDVVKALATVDPARRDIIGGIEIHEESFDW